ncbi:MAG TPA: hypothetical protein VFA75_03715 [Nevskia sp.]|jgi:hypothetical protein|nr:hypothetical protein [Nevskia sp.]
MSGTRKLATLAAILLAGAMSACTSNGNGDNSGSSGGGSNGGGGGGGGIDGSSSSGGPANDGGGNSNITDNGTQVAPPARFICTAGARTYDGVSTAVGANGLVGGQLTTLLNSVGGTSATKLLNSVTEPDNVIDGKLSTFATFTLTAGLLTGTLDSVDESVLFPSQVPAGKFAVFGLSFPNGTANLSLLNSVTVATYLNNVQQEQNTLNQTLLLGLLGQGVLTSPAVWLGIKAEKPYDRATVLLTPGLLSADVGDAMHVYEMCVDGELVGGSSSSSGGSSSSSSSSGGP